MSAVETEKWEARTGDPAFVHRIRSLQARFEAVPEPADDKTLDDAEKAIASLSAFVTAEAAKPDPASKAKAALARSVVWQLQEVLQPALGVARQIEAALDLEAPIEADLEAAADALAGSLMAADGSARVAVFGTPWPPSALALVLTRVEAEQRAAVAADVVAGAGAERSHLPEMCTAAAEMTAAAADDAAAVLEPTRGVRHRTGRIARFVARTVNMVRQPWPRAIQLRGRVEV